MNKKKFLDTLYEWIDTGGYQSYVNYNTVDRIRYNYHKQGDNFKADIINTVLEAYANEWYFLPNVEDEYGNSYDLQDFVNECMPEDKSFTYTGEDETFDFFINGVSVFDEDFEKEVKKELDK